MASNVDFLVAFLLGILPGLVILWASLRRFDRPQVDHTLFDDRRVFGSLAVGLIFGTVASVPTGNRRPPRTRGFPLSVPAPGGRTIRRDLRGHVGRVCPVDLLLHLPRDSAGHASRGHPSRAATRASPRAGG